MLLQKKLVFTEMTRHLWILKKLNNNVVKKVWTTTKSEALQMRWGNWTVIPLLSVLNPCRAADTDKTLPPCNNPGLCCVKFLQYRSRNCDKSLNKRPARLMETQRPSGTILNKQLSYSTAQCSACYRRGGLSLCHFSVQAVWHDKHTT